MGLLKVYIYESSYENAYIAFEITATHYPIFILGESLFRTYFVFFYRVCGLAQRLSLQLIKLLLPLVHDYPLLMDPRSLSNATKELDVILPVTCTDTETGKQAVVFMSLHLYNCDENRLIQSAKSDSWCVCAHTSGVYASVDLHLRVRGNHAGPPRVGSHFGPHQISYHKLLTEARLLDH